MNDLISRQVAVNKLRVEVEKVSDSLFEAEGSYSYCEMVESISTCLDDIPTEQPEHKEPCSACEGLEDGDTLYACSDWDGGIGFDYIRDIKYCPVCGRRLNNG